MTDVYITAVLRLIESQLAASGRFSGGVTVGQLAGPPETPAAAVFLARGSAGLLSMSSFIRRREVTIRIYIDAAAEPRDEAEIAIDEIVYDTEDDIRNNLNLGTTGWIVQGELVEEFDYAEVGGRQFRIADITLPLTYRA
ncbi:MAG: hypothetical protein MUP14_07800 [Dehalococcoidia bacterium]|nr:hypothetical protein [Dehalococcoidia bacterium]